MSGAMTLRDSIYLFLRGLPVALPLAVLCLVLSGLVGFAVGWWGLIAVTL